VGAMRSTTGRPSVVRGDILEPAHPIANFTTSPDQPSTADTIQLLDCSHDPRQVGIAWRAWDFGDGGTSVGAAPVHRYSLAGAYEVTLTVASFDGRVSRHSSTILVGLDLRSEPP
jgi:PKD repeat protein